MSNNAIWLYLLQTFPWMTIPLYFKFLCADKNEQDGQNGRTPVFTQYHKPVNPELLGNRRKLY